ncbi:MAG: tetratricopeptide repeat protein [Chlorobium sp.]
MTGLNSASDEYADNLKIAERFFLKTSRSGFLFAVCNDELVQREVNSTLQFLLQGKGKTLHVHIWQKGDDAVHPLEQLRLLKKSVPNLGGFILAGLDSALFQNPDLLVQLNFGREALSELGLPILFWLSTRTLQRISQEAIDLYNQRVGANLYFEQASETTDTDNAARRYVAQETVRSNDNIRYLEARMKLLQQQLDEAEQQQRDPEVIANEIVLDLLDVYAQIPGMTLLIQELIDRYNRFIDLEKPANCTIVAIASEYVGEIGMSCGLYEKALNRYRALAETNPQAYWSDLAMTLNNLANLQLGKNDYARAEEGYREALGIYRDLYKMNPQTYLPGLAATLNNLAALQSDKNDYAVAEEGYREALQIRRDLAKMNPQTYLPEVAATLNNLAALQSDKNDYAVAEEGYREALQIRRDLAKTNPQTYLPDLATTLNNLALLQAKKNDYAVAEEGYREALQIRRDLAKMNPQTHLHYVAGTLNNLANLQRVKNDYSGAEEVYREALQIRQDLAKTNPQTYLLDVAATLNDLALLQAEKNDYAGAEEGYREALKIRRGLANMNPQTYLPDVAVTLNNLANLQRDINDYAGAEEGYREALQIRRDFAKMNPQTYQPDVAVTLINLGWFYYDAVPEKQKSLESVSEALSIILPLTEKLPYTQHYAESAFKLLKAWGIDPEEFVKQLAMHE